MYGWGSRTPGVVLLQVERGNSSCKWRGKGKANSWEDRAPPWRINAPENGCGIVRPRRESVPPLNPDPPYPSVNAGLENESKEKECISPSSIMGKLV